MNQYTITKFFCRDVCKGSGHACLEREEETLSERSLQPSEKKPEKSSNQQSSSNNSKKDSKNNAKKNQSSNQGSSLKNSEKKKQDLSKKPGKDGKLTQAKCTR